MDELRQLNQVAYVRFASVYREFKDVGQFMSELETIIDEDAQALESQLDGAADPPVSEA